MKKVGIQLALLAAAAVGGIRAADEPHAPERVVNITPDNPGAISSKEPLTLPKPPAKPSSAIATTDTITTTTNQPSSNRKITKRPAEPHKAAETKKAKTVLAELAPQEQVLYLKKKIDKLRKKSHETRAKIHELETELARVKQEVEDLKEEVQSTNMQGE